MEKVPSSDGPCELEKCSALGKGRAEGGQRLRTERAAGEGRRACGRRRGAGAGLGSAGRRAASPGRQRRSQHAVGRSRPPSCPPAGAGSLHRPRPPAGGAPSARLLTSQSRGRRGPEGAAAAAGSGGAGGGDPPGSAAAPLWSFLRRRALEPVPRPTAATRAAPPRVACGGRPHATDNKLC